MSEEEEMKKLKEIATMTASNDIRMKVIDTLEFYGIKAIPFITDIVNSTFNRGLKEHGLEAIQKLKTESP